MAVVVVMRMIIVGGLGHHGGDGDHDRDGGSFFGNLHSRGVHGHHDHQHHTDGYGDLTFSGKPAQACLPTY